MKKNEAKVITVTGETATDTRVFTNEQKLKRYLKYLVKYHNCEVEIETIRIN